MSQTMVLVVTDGVGVEPILRCLYIACLSAGCSCYEFDVELEEKFFFHRHAQSSCDRSIAMTIYSLYIYDRRVYSLSLSLTLALIGRTGIVPACITTTGTAHADPSQRSRVESGPPFHAPYPSSRPPPQMLGRAQLIPIHATP
jgi:hypothetical protein